MPKNKVLSVLIVLILSITICSPIASANSIIATIKDGTVIQTTVNETPASIETNSEAVEQDKAQDQESKSFFGSIFDKFTKDDAPSTEENIKQSQETVSDPGDLQESSIDEALIYEANPVSATAKNMNLIVIKNEKTTGTLDADITGDEPVTYAISTQPAHGTVTLLDAATGSFEYMPETDYTGNDSFGFTTTQEGVTSEAATVSVSVVESTGDTTPTAQDMSITVQKNVTFNGTFEVEYGGEAADLAYEIDTQPTTEALVNIDEETGTFTYEPQTDYVGSDTFKFAVLIAGETSTRSVGTVTVTVTEGEGPTLTANDMSIETAKNQTAAGTLSHSYTGTGTLAFTISVAAQHGTATVTNAATGEFSYAPATDYVGSDTFQFTVSDGTLTDEATVTVTVKEPSPTPPPVTPSIYDDMNGHYARQAAEYFYEENKIRGESVGTDLFFYPDYTMTRLQFITFANTVFPSTNPESTDITNLPFEDVTEDSPDYMKKAAKTAYETGLVRGSEENGKLYLKPYEKLTRIEVLTAIHHMINPPEATDTVLDFTDLSTIPSWAIPYVKDMVNVGLIRGFEDGSFRPFDTITRAQAVTLLYNALSYQSGTPQLLRLK